MNSAKNKKMIDFSKLPDDQLFDVWEGKASDYGVGFCALISPNFRYVFFRDGERTSIAPGTSVIFPFAPKFNKKPLFFQKSRIHTAKLLCVSENHCVKMPWCIEDAVLMNNGRPYRLSASGSVLLSVAPFDTHRFYSANVLISESWNVFASNIKDAIGQCAGACMSDILPGLDLLNENGFSLTPEKIIVVSRMLGERLRTILSIKFGLSLCEESMDHLIDHISFHAI